MKAVNALFAGAALACLPFASQAALLVDFEAGAGIWGAGPSGTAGTRSDEQFDVRDEFGLERETTGFVWADLKLPVLPNLKLTYTPLSFDGTGTVERNINFGTVEFGLGEQDVSTSASLDQFDATLYLQPLDNVVKLGLGLNVKVISGEFEVTREDGQTDRVSFSGPLPMLYANAGFDMPFSPLSGLVEVAAISYSSNRLVDLRAGVRWQLMPLLHVEGGYRRQEIKLRDFDDIYVDLEIGGPYLGMVLKI